MTTLQDSLLAGECSDAPVRGHVETCQAIVGSEWSEGEARDMWTRIAHVLHLWRGTSEPFTSSFRDVDTANDAQLLSRLVQLRRSPIGDWSSAAIEKILALGVLKCAARGDVAGALLLVSDLKEEQKCVLANKFLEHSEAELARSQKGLESLQHQLKLLEGMAEDFKLGKQRREEVRRFGERRHGTPEEKNALWTAYQEAADELRKAHPEWSKADIYRRVATKHKKNPKTIERHVEIQGRKK